MQENPGERRLVPLIVLALIMAAALVQCATVWWNKSITFDETFYLSCALQTAHDGRLDRRLVENGVAPLGALASTLPVAIAVGGRDRPAPWQGQLEDVRWIFAARVVHTCIVMIPLLLLTYGWLAGRLGAPAGVVAAALVGFSPTLIAHSAFATSDGVFAVLALVALMLLSRYRRRRSLANASLAVLGFSACIAAKYSGVFLAPVAMWCLFLDAFHDAEEKGAAIRCWRAAWRTTGRLVILGLCVFVGVWMFHGFQAVSAPGRTMETTPIVLSPAPIHGVVFQMVHNKAGHHGYLMGEYSLSGWWYYFPLALILKSTLVELVLFLAAFVCVAVLCLPQRDRDKDLQSFAVAILVMLLLAMRAQINIGHRYLLPLYPLVIIVCVAQLWDRVSKFKQWVRTGVVGGLVLIQAVSAVFAAPHYLAYFSPLVGGGSRGAEYLVDSNLDWGQDLVLLSRQLEKRGFGRILLHYFGTADPAVYGIDFVPLAATSQGAWSDCDAVVVSETFLRGGYAYGRDPFHHLREIEPVATAGYSLRIYDLRDEKVTSALQAAIEAGIQR